MVGRASAPHPGPLPAGEGGVFRIAGAGPAGLSCAIALARAGRAVVVFEAREAPATGSAAVHEILENWTEEEDAAALFDALDLSAADLASPVAEAELFDHELRRTRVSSRRPFAYLLRRGASEGTLDSALLARARALGVEIRFGERRAVGDVDVFATGSAAPDLVIRRTSFRTESPARVQFLFDPARAPGGLAWLTIVDGAGTLGCLVSRDARHLDRHFDACLQRFRRISNFDVSEEKTSSGGVDLLIAGSSQVGAARVAGAAGGSRDLLLGFGLRGAIADGLVAAESLLSAKSFDALREEHAGAIARASLALRFRFERMSEAHLSRVLARCGRGDFRERLRRCTRPGFAKETLALFARAAWRRPDSCAHVLRDHWCRARET